VALLIFSLFPWYDGLLVRRFCPMYTTD
jgi:hypothetical protein